MGTLQKIAKEIWDDKNFDSKVARNSYLPSPAISLLRLFHEHNTTWDISMTAIALIKAVELKDIEVLSIIAGINPAPKQIINDLDIMSKFGKDRLLVKKVTLKECLHIFKR